MDGKSSGAGADRIEAETCRISTAQGSNWVLTEYQLKIFIRPDTLSVLTTLSELPAQSSEISPIKSA